MRNIFKPTRRESGMVLFTVLLLLSLLMAAGMGAVVSVQNDSRVTGNFRRGAAASYLADAGIEWGKQQIVLTATHPPVLTHGSQYLDSGSFSVVFLSSAPTGPLAANVTLRSVGRNDNATHSVQALVVKHYDMADGALVLRGNARSLNFAGSSLSISGFDHDAVSGDAVPDARPRAGLTVGAPALLNQVAGALDDLQRRNIAGDDGRGATIAVSRHIPAGHLDRIAGDLCAAPSAIVTVVPSQGVLTIGDQIWGSREAPQLRCINGLPGSGDSAVFGANTGGAGTLVIRDAEMVIHGQFRWEGLVLISGGDIGLAIANATDKEIIGALMVNESGSGAGSGPALLNIQGTISLRFSRQALQLAVPLIPPATLAASYGVLPVTLKQAYWRSLNP